MIGLAVTFSLGPLDRDEAQLALLHFLLQLTGIVPNAVADEAIPAAELCVGIDLAPNAFVVGEQAFVREMVEIYAHPAKPHIFPSSRSCLDQKGHVLWASIGPIDYKDKAICRRKFQLPDASRRSKGMPDHRAIRMPSISI